jgi:hypothetical protein
VRSFRFQGPFARIGEHERCEIRVPGIGAPVVAYVQVGEGYLAVLDLSETFPIARCEVQYVLPGGSVWLQPNARLTLESIQHDAPTSDAFSWESFELEDLRVLPNTLVLESGVTKPESKENLFRLTTVLSVLGTDAACQLQLKHRTIAKFQCVIFRGEHLGKPVRVVDLLAASPTLVDDKNANGAVLDVGGRLQCGKMILSARRVLTEALLPTAVSTPTASGSVPGPPVSLVSPTNQSVNPASRPVEPSAPSESSPSMDISIAGGSLSLPPVAKDASTSVPKSGTLVADSAQVLVPRLNPWEERIERNQEAMLSSLQAIANRMESIESSVSNASTDPRWTAALSELERAFGVVLEKISTLELGLNQVSEDTLRELSAIDQKNAASFATLQEHNASQLASLRTTIHGLMENYGLMEGYAKATFAADAVASKPVQQVHSIESVENLKQPAPGRKKESREPTANSAPPNKPAPPSMPAPPSKPAPLSQPAPPSRPRTALAKSSLGTSLDRMTDVEAASVAADDLKPDGGESKLRTLDESLGVPSASNKHLDPDSPELLASSDSPEETLVLGSLMELRQRKASARVMQVTLLTAVFVAVVGIAVPIVWYQIPEGWRELIWRLGAKETVVEPDRESTDPKPVGR